MSPIESLAISEFGFQSNRPDTEGNDFPSYVSFESGILMPAIGC